jgi:hypothetical protein
VTQSIRPAFTGVICEFAIHTLIRWWFRTVLRKMMRAAVAASCGLVREARSGTPGRLMYSVVAHFWKTLRESHILSGLTCALWNEPRVDAGFTAVVVHRRQIAHEHKEIPGCLTLRTAANKGRYHSAS